MNNFQTPSVETPILAEHVSNFLNLYGSITYKQIIDYVESNFGVTEYDLVVTPGNRKTKTPRYKQRVYSLIQTLKIYHSDNVQRVPGGYTLVDDTLKNVPYKQVSMECM
jgi:hypothetical protein